MDDFEVGVDYNVWDEQVVEFDFVDDDVCNSDHYDDKVDVYDVEIVEEQRDASVYNKDFSLSDKGVAIFVEKTL